MLVILSTVRIRDAVFRRFIHYRTVHSIEVEENHTTSSFKLQVRAIAGYTVLTRCAKPEKKPFASTSYISLYITLYEQKVIYISSPSEASTPAYIIYETSIPAMHYIRYASIQCLTGVLPRTPWGITSAWRKGISSGERSHYERGDPR